jgi:hypothetical protein
MKQLLFFTAILFGINTTFAQWQPDVRLTNNTALSLTTAHSNARCSASSGDTVHVVWFDNRSGGNYEIYYKRSTDGGLSWGLDTRISNNVYFSSDPSISISGSVVHIVWDDNRDGNYEIYYNRSIDGGTTWGADTRLTNNDSSSKNPCVSSTGLVVHVVWNDFNTLDIGYKRSVDGGLTWGTDVQLTNDPSASWFPSVSASGPVVHVVWEESRGERADVYYKRSPDGGVTWGIDTPLTGNVIDYSDTPSISVAGSEVHVVFRDSRDCVGTNYGIYYKHSTDAGLTWGADTPLTFDSNTTVYAPSVSVLGSAVHVVWCANRDGNYEIYYNHSTDGGTVWGTNTRLTNNAAVSFYSFVSASSSGVHAVWNDNRDGNYEIYYKHKLVSNPKQLSVKVFLEGPYDAATGAMNTVLKDAGLIPLAQPYQVAPWNYAGTESVLSIPAGVVDWVLVELRDAATPAAAVPGTVLPGWPAAFFLKTDGSVVGLNGTNLPDAGTFTVTNSLFVVIHHRNHLAVLSATPATLTGDIYSYDFTADLTRAYRGDSGYKTSGSNAVMVAGDINHDGSVFVNDFNSWAAEFGSTSGYYSSDLDMDRNVYVSDYNKWAANFGSATGSTGGGLIFSVNLNDQVRKDPVTGRKTRILHME